MRGITALSMLGDKALVLVTILYLRCSKWDKEVHKLEAR